MPRSRKSDSTLSSRRLREAGAPPLDASPEERADAVLPWPSDLAYLQAELHWIEARCARLLLEKQARRTDDSKDPGSRSIFRRDDDDAPTPADARAQLPNARAEEEALRSWIDVRVQAHRVACGPLAIDDLVAAHGLSELERLTLLLAAAPCVSRRFENLYAGFEAEQQPSLTVDAVFSFAELDFEARVRYRATFGPRGRLVARDLVEMPYRGRNFAPKELLGTEIVIRGRTLSYLLGDTGLGDELDALASVEKPVASFDRLVLPAADKARILRVVGEHERVREARRSWGLDDVVGYGRGALLLFHGAPGTGKTMAAHAIAEKLGKRVLTVDIPTFTAHAEAGRFIPGLFREARLQDAVLFFDECESLFESRARGNALMTVLLTEVERFEGVAILATNLPQRLDEALDRRILVRIRFPEPDAEAREAIWRGLLPATVPLAPDVDLRSLAERHELAGGYIKNAVLAAAAHAVYEPGADGPRITHAMLAEAAREQSGRGFGDDEAPPEVPRARLDDVVLPPDIRREVDELVAAARSRRTVLERWGLGAHFSHGKGIAALLHGPPGTGKTLCAEAIAGELGRPLLHASIAGVLSPFQGETERGLSLLFTRAKRLGAVLFLDEADTLLGDRDRTPATRAEAGVVNVLLTEIERFDGVVLVATNLATRLDGALARRLAWNFALRRPEAGARAGIWRRLLGPEVPCDGPIDTEALGARFAISGGRIKNAVFKAAYRAARAQRGVTMADLERAAREEVEADTPPGSRPVGFGMD
jgi:SpoVK/Ycf46/Vps4 family AAA+-type ATPase